MAVRKILGVTMLSLMVSSCATHNPGSDLVSTDNAEVIIHDASALWVETYNRNDWAALAELFAEDAVMLPPNSEKVVGRSAIIDWETEYETGFRIAFDIEAIEIGVKLAYVQGRSCVFVPNDAGGFDVDLGKFLEVRRKQPDGDWLIEVDAFNSDLPVGSALLETCPFAPMPE